MQIQSLMIPKMSRLQLKYHSSNQENLERGKNQCQHWQDSDVRILRRFLKQPSWTCFKSRQRNTRCKGPDRNLRTESYTNQSKSQWMCSTEERPIEITQAEQQRENSSGNQQQKQNHLRELSGYNERFHICVITEPQKVERKRVGQKKYWKK